MNTAPSPILVVQHVSYEPPAEYETVLVERGIDIDRVVLDGGARLPVGDGYAGIVSMGGPMGVDDVQAHPWLTAEEDLIRDAVLAGTPFWGVCLGAQLLASALGARVFTGPRPEVGMHELTRTAEAADDPVFGSMPERSRVFQWHCDSFDLPDGAQLLASSANYPHQAFRVGSAYGLQFHVEITADLASQWLAIPAYASALDAALGPGAAPALLADLRESFFAMRELARRLFSGWLDAYVVAHPDGAREARAVSNQVKEATWPASD